MTAYLLADPLAKRQPHLPEEELYDLAERAAIIEYCADIDREVAELIVTGGAS